MISPGLTIAGALGINPNYPNRTLVVELGVSPARLPGDVRVAANVLSHHS